MSICIMTDSNSGITQEEGKKLGVPVIPMPFTINGKDYFEDINLGQEEFYNLLDEKFLAILDVETLRSLADLAARQVVDSTAELLVRLQHADAHCIFVGDLQAELLLEVHDQLDRVEGLSTQVRREAGGGDDLFLRATEFVGDDVDNFLFNRSFFHFFRF